MGFISLFEMPKCITFVYMRDKGKIIMWWRRSGRPLKCAAIPRIVAGPVGMALQNADERCFRVVEMRYFGGMTEEDIAAELGVSLPTVKRDWRKARAFLFDQLR